MLLSFLFDSENWKVDQNLQILPKKDCLLHKM